MKISVGVDVLLEEDLLGAEVADVVVPEDGVYVVAVGLRQLLVLLAQEWELLVGALAQPQFPEHHVQYRMFLQFHIIIITATLPSWLVL